MTTILMIRHGESQANRQGVFAGHYDVPLEPNGLEQAKATARFIADNYTVSKVYASDLKRAFVTGKTLSDLVGVPIIPDDRLREIRAGKWDGMHFADIMTEYSDAYNVWMTDIGNAVTTDGESVKELAERIKEVLTEISLQNDGATVAVATHATPIRIMQTLIQKGTLDEMKNIKWVSNASVTELVYNNGNFECKAVGLDSHLSKIKTVLPANV